MLRLWNYLRGYVIIIVEGYFIEKFINICTRRQIPLWDVRVQKEQLLTMKTNIKGFKLIRPVAKKAGCKVRLLKKIGLPFLFNRYRRRKAFFAGAALFIALIYVMTSFVWSVEIKGNSRLQTEQLTQALARNGIRTGILKYGIDTDRAVTGMMLEIGDISWISIVVKGTKVKVDLRERIEVPQIVPRHIPCDIIAEKDGIIKQVIATAGVEAAGEGDTVRRGQVLISGSIPLKGQDKSVKLVHAMGTVTARTWYEDESPVILAQIERLRTGRVINDHALRLFSFSLDLIHRKNNFQSYSVTEVRKKISIGEDLVFPIEWVTVKYIEEKLVEAVVNESDAKNAAAAAAYKKVLARIPEKAEIVKESVSFVQDENKGLTAKVIVECLEDIGTSKRIGGK